MDENRVLLVPLEDGLAIEAVAYPSGTLCLSSQAGCAVGCPFCASGRRGLQRNLTIDELWRQVAAAREGGFEPQRLTLSGVGEPLHNFRTVMAFVAAADSERLPVSVTTCGAPLKHLRPLLEARHNGVMLSLHAGTASCHSRLIPGGGDFDALWQELAEWHARATRRQRRRLGFNYLLLQGVNDGPDELRALVEQLRGFPEATLHLLQGNPVPDSPFVSPPPAQFDAVHAAFRREGIHVRRSNRWRQQSHGGCGTLYVRHGHSQEKEALESCLSD